MPVIHSFIHSVIYFAIRVLTITTDIEERETQGYTRRMKKPQKNTQTRIRFICNKWKDQQMYKS